MTTEKYPVQTIRAYLLGQLPEPESERLDELSITEDACAERIRQVEDDLVDAFARGELHEPTLDLFRSRYLTTPRRREMTRFAQALQSLDEPSLGAASPEVQHKPAPLAGGKPRWRELLALAAVLVLATATVWLVLDNRMLRSRTRTAESARDGFQRDLQRRDAEAARTASLASPPTDTATPLTVAVLVLAPQLRSASQLPTMSLTDATKELPVQIELEPVDYPSYSASLLASSGNRQLWVADRLSPRTVRGQQTLDLRLPANLLSPQEYLIRVSGVPTSGASEIVGEYRFRVVR